MAFQLDFTKLPAEIVLDQINNDNSSSLTTAQVSFGIPTAATGTSPVRDTDLTVSAVPNQGYTGDVIVHYNRVDMATIPGTRSTTFPKGTATKISDLIPQINAAYQLNLQPEDYKDADLPTFSGAPNEKHDFQLSAGEDSLCFKNSVTLTVHADDIPLASVITNQTLNGLVYTQPASN